MAERNPMQSLEARLAEVLPDTPLRPAVLEAVVGAQGVIKALRRLDDSLYERLSVGSVGVLESENPGPELDTLKAATFQDLEQLIHTMRAHGLVHSGDDATNIPDDFDFDMVDSSPPAPAQDSLAVNELDIDDALGALASPSGAAAKEALLEPELRELLATIAGGVVDQLEAFEGRFARAVEGGNHRGALEDLDDTRNAASEAMFAMVSGVFSLLLPEFPSSSLVPGYLSTMERALMLRRNLADMTHRIEAQNMLVQDRSVDVPSAEHALERVRTVLKQFIRGDAFTAMRPADRWELMKFSRALGRGTLASVRQECEGLSKYLESLSSINQRESLRRHDGEALREVAGLMEAAQPLLAISVAAAGGQVKEALPLFNSLYGRTRELDALLTAWRINPPDLGVRAELEDVIARLREWVRVLGG